MGLSLEHLLWYTDEGEDILNRTVTGDESWVHHYSYQPESKSASMQWKHPSSLSAKKFKVTPSAGKIILTVFWDSQGLLLAHFQKRGEKVNSASYCKVPLKLRDAICRNRPGQLARGVLLHHDNARPHTARVNPEENSRTTFRTSRTSALQPGLGPPVMWFHLFGPLKNTLVANVSLMTKRLKRRCGSGCDNTQKMLRVSTQR
jgi:hypothetical protein